MQPSQKWYLVFLCLHIFEPNAQFSRHLQCTPITPRNVFNSSSVLLISQFQLFLRRNTEAEEPFLAFEVVGTKAVASDALPIDAINSGAALLEKALGRPLYPLR